MNPVNPLEEHINEIISLLKSYYPTHDVFTQSDSEIESYLLSKEESAVILTAEDDSIMGFSYLVQIGGSEESDHKRWKFQHFAVKDDDSKIADDLLATCEDIISESSKTAKIEINVAESEKLLDMYEKNSYVKEASLENHYRFGEVCYIFGENAQMSV